VAAKLAAALDKHGQAQNHQLGAPPKRYLRLWATCHSGGSRIVLDSTSPQLNCSGIVNLVHVGI